MRVCGGGGEGGRASGGRAGRRRVRAWSVALPSPSDPPPRPLLLQQAVGVIGNLVHSSAGIKRRVLEEGALQPVINLLSSPCADSQREAALLLGQFATGERRGVGTVGGYCG